MRNKITTYILALFVLSSCSNWLDIDLANRVDEDKLFSKAEGFKEALAGAYSTMSKKAMYGSRLSMEHLDAYAQYYASSNTYEEHQQYNYTNSGVKSSHNNLWNSLYKTVATANVILENCHKRGDVMNTETYNQVYGEAIAIRAFAHFDLYRLFCPDVKLFPKADGIPYNKEFGVSLPPLYTVEEVVQLVINDLLEAEKYLANDNIVNVVPYTFSLKNESDKYVARINLYAVKAMLARAYQARGDWNKAITKAEEVINSGKFRLLDFSSVDKPETEQDILFSDEHIFSLRNRELSDISKDLHYKKVTESSTTLAPLQFVEMSTTFNGNVDDQRYVKWFVAGNFMKFTLSNSDTFFPKMPIIKLSEMYLLIAECCFKQDPAKALKMVNTLRDHRIRNNAHWNFLTQEYIIEEMKREYLGEGQLWYAYKRNNLPMINPQTGTAIEASDALYVFPMPDREIEVGNRN